MSRRNPNPPLWSLDDDLLDHREALYLRLLRSTPATSPIAAQLHRRLNEVKLERFRR